MTVEENREFMIKDLAKSGLVPGEDMEVEPLVDEQQTQERLGFTSIKDKDGNTLKIADIGGHWIKYENVPGYYRLKLREEIETIDEETGRVGRAKYLSPKGKGNHVYLPKGVREKLKKKDPHQPIYVTEGEKKAAKATKEGFPCIGLSGVWNFANKGDDFLDELKQYDWAGRNVYIVFDSDILEKEGVRHAELRLGVRLMNRGAKTYAVRLTNGTKNEEEGI